MSHLVEQMAYVGQTPWHGLGNALSVGQPLEVWAEQSGLSFSILDAPVRYVPQASNYVHAAMGTVALGQEFAGHKVLYRSDTLAPLSVVSERYQVVQPRDVLEFYRDLTQVAGYELETAGVLKGGRKLWALARTGQSAALKGRDTVNGYVLLATACDGTLATTAQFTSVRVVCNNTLGIALSDGSQAVKVRHNTAFNADAVKRQLGLSVASWDSFMYRMRMLSERRVQSHEAMKFYLSVFADPQGAPAVLANERAMRAAQRLYEGHGLGAELAAAKDTAWGLLSSITEFVDHRRRARNQDNRLDSAWFGTGAALKQRALDEAMKLIA